MNQRCLDREILIYDIWHLKMLTVPRTAASWRLASSAHESHLLIRTDVGREIRLHTQPIGFLFSAPFAGSRINTPSLSHSAHVY